jgi:hypothetical protein
MSQSTNGKSVCEKSDTEVVAKAQRWQYPAEYKQRAVSRNNLSRMCQIAASKPIRSRRGNGKVGGTPSAHFTTARGTDLL